MFGDRVQQCHGLQPVACRSRSDFITNSTAIDRVLDACHDQALPELCDTAIAKIESLGEVVPSIDVHRREGKTRRAECLFSKTEQDRRILSSREQDDGALELRHGLTKYVDTLG